MDRVTPRAQTHFLVSPDPFTTPREEPRPVPQEAEHYAPCPACHARAARTLGYTWWGGWMGAALLKHVECTACGRRYNGNTGGSNT